MFYLFTFEKLLAALVMLLVTLFVFSFLGCYDFENFLIHQLRPLWYERNLQAHFIF